MERGKIYNLQRYKQAKLIDFSGFEFERKITPTDVDFFLEIQCREFIIGEFKSGKSLLPFGQRHALTELLASVAVDPSKKVLGFIAFFNANADEIIVAADCIVSEVWHSSRQQWKTRGDTITVKELILRWRQWHTSKAS